MISWHLCQRQKSGLTCTTAPEQQYLHSHETTGWFCGSGVPGAEEGTPQCWLAQIWNTDVVAKERARDTAWHHQSLTCIHTHPTHHWGLPHCCLPVCHWSQSLRNQGQSLDETSGSDLPRSVRKQAWCAFYSYVPTPCPQQHKTHAYYVSLDYVKNPMKPSQAWVILWERVWFLTFNILRTKLQP